MEGERWMIIRNDRLKGMNYEELSKRYHIDPRTAKKYAESPQRPEYILTNPKPTKLDEYKQQIDFWFENCHCAINALVIQCYHIELFKEKCHVP